MKKPEWRDVDWDKRCEELTVLAQIDHDQSADYEVDQTLIGYDPATKKIVLLQAPGCSCWNGEASEMVFDNLNQVKKYLMECVKDYSGPSLEGSKELLSEARKAFRQMVNAELEAVDRG